MLNPRVVQNLERKVAEQFWNGQCQWAHVQQLKENKIWQSVKVKNIKGRASNGGKSVGRLCRSTFLHAGIRCEAVFHAKLSPTAVHVMCIYRTLWV